MEKTGGSALAPHTIVGAVEPEWLPGGTHFVPQTLVSKGDDPDPTVQSLHSRLIAP